MLMYVVERAHIPLPPWRGWTADRSCRTDPRNRCSYVHPAPRPCLSLLLSWWWGGGEVVMVMVVWCGVVVVVVYRVMGSGRVGWVREKRVCYERRRTEGGL